MVRCRPRDRPNIRSLERSRISDEAFRFAPRRIASGTHTGAIARGTLVRFAVVIEKADGNYSAYVSDLLGCVAIGATVEEVEREIRDAIRFHIDGLREDGLPVPQPTDIAEYVET